MDNDGEGFPGRAIVGRRNLDAVRGVGIRRTIDQLPFRIYGFECRFQEAQELTGAMLRIRYMDGDVRGLGRSPGDSEVRRTSNGSWSNASKTEDAAVNPIQSILHDLEGRLFPVDDD